MRLHRPRLPARGEPVVVLIDVVFFLLVFFMLVARLDATAPFEVQPPVALSGADMPAGGATLAIALDGAFAVDGRPVEDSDWLTELQTAAEGEQLIRVNAHAEAELRHLLPVLAALERAALGEVVLVVTPEGG
jgi:biopolymer transport protein ExbD